MSEYRSICRTTYLLGGVSAKVFVICQGQQSAGRSQKQSLEPEQKSQWKHIYEKSKLTDTMMCSQTSCPQILTIDAHPLHPKVWFTI